MCEGQLEFHLRCISNIKATAAMRSPEKTASDLIILSALPNVTRLKRPKDGLHFR